VMIHRLANAASQVDASTMSSSSSSRRGLCALMDASTASLCGPVYQGSVRTKVAVLRGRARGPGRGPGPRGWRRRRCAPCPLGVSGCARTCQRTRRRSCSCSPDQV
jgi:hypothetical protein